MMLKRHHRPRTRGIPYTRLAGATVAAVGLSVAAIAVAPAAAKSSLVISTSKSSQFGTVLVNGTALYTLKPSSSPCNSACTKIWPEVLLPKGVTKAKAGSGVNAAKLGTIKRAHGKLQVTYGGKPLYRFAEDAPGQVNGNVTDAWGKWSVVSTVPPTSTSGSGSGGSTAGSGGTSF